MVNIYLDETEDAARFVVGGIITTDNEELLRAIHITRNYVKNKKKIATKHRNQILNELKEYYLTKNDFEDIKINFYENLASKKNKKGISVPRTEFKVVYMEHKKDDKFNHEWKEAVYKETLEALLESITDVEDGEVILMYDEFGNKNFKEYTERLPFKYLKLGGIASGNSQMIKELQAADMCIGAVRRYLNQEENSLFHIISDLTSLIEKQPETMQITK